MKEFAKSGRPRSTQADRSIIQATLDLLAEVGYERTSIEAIASRAGVGKTTIYRRYSSKAELVADALESRREQISIPDTGDFWRDFEILIEQGIPKQDSYLERQTIATIVSTSSSNPEFAEIYWKKYVLPRRKAFCQVFDRAKERGEISPDVDNDFIVDLLIGYVLFTLCIKPQTEPFEVSIRVLSGFLLNQ
ncbi:TetR family transcriptional regulator [Scytonema sp. UIC 10036]|uniref:TetR/AcrR family transcriptional regulator n=1 Tax=Scytonema sp. UIC 10036 TaxID=2304196 RepID=UPI0012DA9C97|nr:TetR/AcrR family transcriptional regulator [Scytonema sp. UIC 10036]MUH01679.1 TetR family transcriptional regulator [Scytonema sp. UIC 10036]